jgi:hypothetical protein
VPPPASTAQAHTQIAATQNDFRMADDSGYFCCSG